MSSLHKKSLIATAAIFCCRFTGLLREIVFTALFGATAALDAFLTAFRIPNMLRDMFAEGALSQSFTSVMSKVEKQEGKDAAWALTNQVVSQLISLMLIIVSLGVLLSGVFIKTLYLGDYITTNCYIVSGDEKSCIVIDPATDAETILKRAESQGYLSAVRGPVLQSCRGVWTRPQSVHDCRKTSERRC